MNKDEQNRLLNVCNNNHVPTDELVIRVLIYGGLRASELAHMQLKWINYQQMQIEMPRTQPCDCEDCKKHDNLWISKTEAAERSIPLFLINEETWFALGKYFTLFTEMKIKRKAIWKRVVDCAERAKIPHKVFPHALRSTCAMNLAYMGLGEMDICRILGWQDLNSASPYVKKAGVQIRKTLEQMRLEGKRA